MNSTATPGTATPSTATQSASSPSQADLSASTQNASSPSQADLTAELVDDPAGIDTLRGQIDALDTAISRLVAERAQLSRRIQRARINGGGTRVELGRERAIVAHYRDTLGSAGPAMAEAVLRVCRG
ncbi:MAG: chorismate mutase [Actinomycetota bacterium]|nr:chorismate mutase [Actinomycetota bacterium]MDQ2955786.1 chorismate mutase [Actinomycetota bacterium]